MCMLKMLIQKYLLQSTCLYLYDIFMYLKIKICYIIEQSIIKLIR